MLERKRRSLRLQGYDYGQAGAYFVTICTAGRACLFGEVVGYEVRLNELGRVVEGEWIQTAEIRTQALLDVFVVMPNHFHAVLVITDRRGVLPYAPSERRSPSQTIGAIIRGWKAAVTKRINQLRGTPGVPVWQRNYYEHVIRNERDLESARRYIEENPARWTVDRENPESSHRR